MSHESDKCPNCGFEFETLHPFCERCGFDLKSFRLSTPKCPKCLKVFKSGTKFCPEDGNPLCEADLLIAKCEVCGQEYKDGSRFCHKDGGAIRFLIHSQPDCDVEGIHSHDSFNVIERLKEGYRIFKPNIKLFVGWISLLIVMSLAQYFFGALGAFLFSLLFSIFISIPILTGLLNVANNLHKKRLAKVSVMSTGYDNFWQNVLAVYVGVFIISIGLLLLIVPGIYFAVSYMFALLIVIECRASFWNALEVSRKIVTKNWGNYFLFILSLWFIATLSLLPGIIVLIIAEVTSDFFSNEDLEFYTIVFNSLSGLLLVAGLSLSLSFILCSMATSYQHIKDKVRNELSRQK